MYQLILYCYAEKKVVHLIFVVFIQVYHIVDGDVLRGLLAYVASEFPHFGRIPRRQVQRLNSVQYAQLDQLQPNTLVHLILKIVSIAILTGKFMHWTSTFRTSELPCKMTVELLPIAGCFSFHTPVFGRSHK